MAEVRTQTAAELGRMIGAGKLDPRELADEFLAAILASSECDAIYAKVSVTRAKAEAKAAHERAVGGMRRSPLDGVPVSWKDLFDSEGLETQAGSVLLKGRIPKTDCQVLTRASQAGTVCLGKTHMSELAFSGLGINPKTATSPNLKFPNCAPGGSSSGSAASIAFQLAPVSIGSDTGGSVRIPAAWNDLVGLKTTYGLIPTDGVVPLCKGFDSVGPLAKSVEDASLIHEILSGEKVDLSVDVDLANCSFLICETLALDNLDDGVKAGFEAAVQALEKAGAKITSGKIPEYDALTALGPILFPYEAWAEWGEIISANPDAMFEPVRTRFYNGKGIEQEAYLAAQEKMMQLRRKLEQRLGAHDAVIMPTVPILPPAIEPLINDQGLFGDTNLLALRNTRLANLSGAAALTLPTSVSGAGISLVGAPRSEIHLLRIGKAAERLYGNA